MEGTKEDEEKEEKAWTRGRRRKYGGGVGEGGVEGEKGGEGEGGVKEAMEEEE